MDIPEPIQKYWPYMLGGAVGIFIIVKMSGGNSGSGSVISTAGDPAIAAINAQSVRDANNLAAQREALAMQGNIEALKAQGQAAKDVGSAAAMVISTLQAPTVTAINAAAAENIGTVQSAVAAAMAGYNAQAAATNSAAQGSYAIAQGLKDSSNALAIAIASSNASIGAQQSAIKPAQSVKGNDYSGLVSLAGAAFFSDETLKVNIVPTEEDSLSLISRVDFMSFDYTDPKFGDPHPVGAIAQQLREINPAWVGETEEGWLYIKVPQFLMSIAHAQKQLNKKVDAIREANNG